MEIFTNVVVVWPTTGRRVIRYTAYNKTGGILSNRYIQQSRIFGVLYNIVDTPVLWSQATDPYSQEASYVSGFSFSSLSYRCTGVTVPFVQKNLCLI